MRALESGLPCTHAVISTEIPCRPGSPYPIRVRWPPENRREWRDPVGERWPRQVRPLPLGSRWMPLRCWACSHGVSPLAGMLRVAGAPDWSRVFRPATGASVEMTTLLGLPECSIRRASVASATAASSGDDSALLHSAATDAPDANGRPWRSGRWSRGPRPQAGSLLRDRVVAQPKPDPADPHIMGGVPVVPYGQVQIQRARLRRENR